MKRRIYILYIMLSTVLPTFAQYINVNIYEKGEDGQRIGMSGVVIYSFLKESVAKKAYEMYEKGESIDNISGLLDMQETEGNMVQMKGFSNGYLLLDFGFSTTYISCTKYAREEADGTYIEYTFDNPSNKKKKDFEKDATLYLGMKDVIGHQKTKKKDPPPRGGICGKSLYYSRILYLDSLLTRSDARCVVIPFLVEVGKDSAYMLDPKVLDGEAYHSTMHRRMGYKKMKNSNNELHDKLGKYVDERSYMHTRGADSILVVCRFTGIDENKKYKIIGQRWYEDYNEVYGSERVLIWDGNPHKPQRYLDWKSSVVNVPIKLDRYPRKRIMVKSSNKASLHLSFKQGQHVPDYSDSATVADLEKITQRLRGILANAESSLGGITLRGYTSPEGGFATNKSLSRRRAAEVQSILASKSGVPSSLIRLEFDEYDNVRPWTKVIEYLDSLDTDETRAMADEVRATLATAGSNMDAQGRAVQRCSCWSYIKDNVLKALRIVEVEYEVVEQRIIPDEETFQRFAAQEPGYWDGEQLKPYQFYSLLPWLHSKAEQTGKKEDWDNLERLSKAAYESESMEMQSVCWKHTHDKRAPEILQHDSISVDTIWTETAVYDSILGEQMVQNYTLKMDTLHKGDTLSYALKHTSDFYRPYELAAYYYSLCKIRKNSKDVKMLQNYLDESNNGLEHRKRDSKGRLREWWNDEALVMNQIMLYCNNDDFESAYRCAYNHLPAEDRRFFMFRMMLRALNCEWEEPEVRDAVASSSPMNACAMYVAQNTPEYYVKLDSVLRDTTKFNMQDARYHYLKAIARFHNECKSCDDLDVDFYPAQNIYYDGYEGDEAHDWASPMLKAIELDPSNEEFLKTDGYFNNAYRTLVLYFWERKKANPNMTIAEIAKEYDKLRNEAVANAPKSGDE